MGTSDKLPCAVWLAVVLATLAPALAQAAPPTLQGSAPVRPVSQRSVGSNSADRESRSIRIAYHDLDLTTPEGIAALYVRIHRAAAELCDANSAPTGTRIVAAGANACVRNSISATVKQIGIPGLATLEAEQQVLGTSVAAPKPQCDAPARAKIII